MSYKVKYRFYAEYFFNLNCPKRPSFEFSWYRDLWQISLLMLSYFHAENKQNCKCSFWVTRQYLFYAEYFGPPGVEGPIRYSNFNCSKRPSLEFSCYWDLWQISLFMLSYFHAKNKQNCKCNYWAIRLSTGFTQNIFLT